MQLVVTSHDRSDRVERDRESQGDRDENLSRSKTQPLQQRREAATQLQRPQRLVQALAARA